MHYSDIRYSTSHTSNPNSQLVILPNKVNQNANVPPFQTHINNNRLNPLPYNLPPRPPEYPNDPKFGNSSTANQNPLMFNLHSPRTKMKLGNRPPSIPTNKSQNNFNLKSEIQQFNNETSLMSQVIRQDASQANTGFMSMGQVPNGMAINIKKESSAKLPFHRYENFHSHRQSHPPNDKEYAATNNYKLQNYLFVLDNVPPKTKDPYTSSKQTNLHQDHRYLHDQIKLQKQTIQHFQSQITRLNTQVRHLKTNQQNYRKNSSEARRNSSGSQVDAKQTQLSWQQDQNSKLLEQIQKMEIQIQQKNQLYTRSQQLCERYLSNHKNDTQQFANFKDQAAKQERLRTQNMQVLTSEVNRQSKIIREYSQREEDNKGIVKDANNQKQRLSQIIQGLKQNIQQMQSSLDTKEFQIDKLKMRLQNFQAKYQKKTQLYAELQLKIKIQKSENDRLRAELDSQKKKQILEKHQLQQRERLIQAEKDRVVQMNSKLNVELSQLTNDIAKLKLSSEQQKSLLKDKLDQSSKQKQIVNSQLKRKLLENQDMKANVQHRDNSIIQMQQTINNKEEENAKIANSLQKQQHQLQNSIVNLQKITTQKIIIKQKLLKLQHELAKTNNEKDKLKAQHQQEIQSLKLTIKENQDKYQKELVNLNEKIQTNRQNYQELCAAQQKLKVLQLQRTNAKIGKQTQTEGQSKKSLLQLQPIPFNNSSQSIQTQANPNCIEVERQAFDQISHLLKFPLGNSEIMKNLILGLKKMIQTGESNQQLSLYYSQLLEIFSIQPSENFHDLLLNQIQYFRNSLRFLIQSLKEEEKGAQRLSIDNQKLKSQLHVQSGKARRIAQELSISNELNLQLNEMVMQQAARISSIKWETSQAVLTAYSPQSFSANSFQEITMKSQSF